MKTDNEMNSEDKLAELEKYRDLVLATIDYLLQNKLIQLKTTDLDSDQHYKGLKKQTIQHFDKGRLSKLKQWSRCESNML